MALTLQQLRGFKLITTDNDSVPVVDGALAGDGGDLIHDNFRELSFVMDLQGVTALNTGELVFNNGGGTLDVRFEGDTDSVLLFIDGGLDQIGMGTNAPTEKLDVAGNIVISDGFLLLSDVQTKTIAAADSVDIESAVSLVSMNSASTFVVDLAAGTAGQIKTVLAESVAGGGQIDLTPSSMIGGATISFDSTGQSAELQYVDSNWYIKSVYGATVA